jgi:hypothetical protein
MPAECSVLRTVQFISQAGTKLTGRYTYRNSSSVRTKPFTATLGGERNIRITLDDGSVTLTGEVLLNDYLLPWGVDSAERVLRLTAIGGADDGKVLDFEYQTHDW